MGQRLRSKRGTDTERERERAMGLVVVVVVGVQRQGEEERSRDGKVRKGGGESSHFSSFEHPLLHIIVAALLSCVTPLTLRKIDSLITTACKSACLPVH